MKIIVPIKRVIDYRVRIRVKPDKSGVDLSNVKMSINPFDEIAVEEAIRLKESGIATEVIVVTIGGAESHETLRSALALGADRAIIQQVPSDIYLYPLQIAKLLKEVVLAEQPGLIIMGKQSIDGDNNQTGQMLAGLLDWPQATFASKIEKINNNQNLLVTREVDGGLQTLQIDLPAVVTTDLRLNQPRYASLPNIMKAKNKPLQIFKTHELEDFANQKTPEILEVNLPPTRAAGVMVSNVDELIDKLHKDEKLI